MFWTQTVVVVLQLCEYTKNHLIVYFTWVNFILCNLQLNKAVKREKAHEMFCVGGRGQEDEGQGFRKGSLA